MTLRWGGYWGIAPAQRGGSTPRCESHCPPVAAEQETREVRGPRAGLIRLVSGVGVEPLPRSPLLLLFASPTEQEDAGGLRQPQAHIVNLQAFALCPELWPWVPEGLLRSCELRGPLGVSSGTRLGAEVQVQQQKEGEFREENAAAFRVCPRCCRWSLACLQGLYYPRLFPPH